MLVNLNELSMFLKKIMVLIFLRWFWKRERTKDGGNGQERVVVGLGGDRVTER